MRRRWLVEIVLGLIALGMYVTLLSVTDALVAGVITLAVIYGAWFLWKRRDDQRRS